MSKKQDFFTYYEGLDTLQKATLRANDSRAVESYGDEFLQLAQAESRATVAQSQPG